MVNQKRTNIVLVLINVILAITLALSYPSVSQASQRASEAQGSLAETLLYLPIVLRNYVWSVTGALDPSFDYDGKLVTDFSGGDDTGQAVALQTDGKIVVAGWAYGATPDFAVARYNPDGSLDTGFDGDGKVVTDFAGGNDYGKAVVLQADGKIVVAGGTAGATDEFALVRYNPDGSLDTGFDGDGRVVTDFAGGNDYGNAVALQADGKIVVAGYTEGATLDFAVARYNPDGSLDTGFDGDGKLVTDFSGGDDLSYAVVLQADGKIVVAGYTVSATWDFAVARYNPDGSLDMGFDGDGKVATDYDGGTDYGKAVVLQADGKIVLAGITYSATADFAVARYNPDGSLDTGFDGDGRVVTDFAGGDDRGYAIALQADGKIVMAGSAYGATLDFAVARYNPDGSLDTTFDGDGKLVTDFAGGDDWGYAVALQADGKIVVAGYAESATRDFAVARYR